MRVTLQQTAEHAPWQVGEILTIEVAEVADDGTLICETHDTFPPDLKEQHRAALEELSGQHKQEVEVLQAQLDHAQRAMAEVLAGNVPAAEPEIDPSA